jgi:hypothetical protein
MKEEKGIIYTEVKIPVSTPVRYCSECRYQQYSAAQEPCNTCMKDTKGSKWEPA